MNEAKTDGRAERAEARARRACQRLVEVVGASGPCSVEDAAERAAKRIRELEAERDEWAARVAAVTDALHRIEGEYGCQCSPPCPSDGDEACVSAIAGDALRHFGGRAEALLRERDAMRADLAKPCCATDHARVCDKPGCCAAVIRRDDGHRYCAAGHPTRWCEVEELCKAEAERDAMRDALQRIGRAVDKADESNETRCAFIRGILRGLEATRD